MIVPLFLLIALTQTPSPLYKVTSTLATPEAKVGEAIPLDVKFDLAKDAHISDEAPLTIKLSGDGLSFEKPVLHYADASKPTGPAPAFREKVTASALGTHTADVEMSFYVCTAELCNRATEHQKITLTVK